MDIQNFDAILSQAQNAPKKELTELLICLTNAYHNSSDKKDVLPDAQFDALVDIYEERFEKWNYIGAKVEEGKKVKLPYFLASMNKIKATQEKEIKNWKKEYLGPYIIEDKLDGVSGLLLYNKTSSPTLYTRGDGNEGSDITKLVKYLKLPSVPKGDFYAIRGEVIMKKSVFDTKYSTDFRNSRNLVSGIVNSKKLKVGIAQDLDFVAYELIDNPTGNILKISDQLSTLQTLGFEIPNLCSLSKSHLTVEHLTTVLNNFRTKSTYEIDGIVILDNSKAYKRNLSGNPKFAFAFKNIRESKIAKVVKIIWTASRYGVLVPKIEIQPIILNGVTIKFASAFDAKFIKNGNIGPGTQVEITRSGDVIPYILCIVKGSKAQMPKEKYYWGKSGVNIYLEEKHEENTAVQIAIITNFFNELRVKGLAKKTIENLHKQGFDTIHKILYASVSDLINADFGPKQSQNIVDSIESSIRNVDLAKLMAATTIFGVGLGAKKIKLIIDKFGSDILNIRLTKTKLKEEIAQLSGWSQGSAEQFVDKLAEFKKFINLNKKIIFAVLKTKKAGKFKGEIIVFSGIRDPDLEKIIIKEGGDIKNTVSKNTTLLITKDISSNTAKVKEAKRLGIKIISLDEFANKL